MALSFSNTVNSNGLNPNGLTSIIKPNSNLGQGLSITPSGQVATPLQNSFKPAAQAQGLVPAAPATAPLVKPPVQTATAAPISSPTPNIQDQLTSAQQQALALKGQIDALSSSSTGSNQGSSTTGGTSPAGAPTYSGLVSGLVSNAQNTAQQGQMTPEEAAARQQLAKLTSDQANATANIGTHGWSSAFQGGEEALTERNVQAQQQALAEKISAYAAERGANTTALSAAGTQLGAAAGYAAPQVTTPGQAVFNPVTGTYTSASSGGGGSAAPSGIDQASWDQYVNDYASGNFGAIPSSITGNTNLSGQLQQAVQAKNPGFDYNTAVGQGQGNQQVGATQGGIQSTQQQQIASYKSAQQQGQNLASQAVDLINTFGLNPSELTAANGAIQKIAKNVSNPQYQILSNYLNDIAARYSQILTPPGGTATDTTRSVATGMLDSLASGKSIQSVLGALDQQATAVIAGIPSTGTAIGNSGGSSSTSGFGWDGN